LKLDPATKYGSALGATVLTAPAPSNEPQRGVVEELGAIK
jgi:hypothetical protein